LDTDVNATDKGTYGSIPYPVDAFMRDKDVQGFVSETTRDVRS